MRSKATVLTFAEKCRNILASNWQGQLNTIKADAKGSKEDIFSSKVKYIIRRGKPYIWVPENELHNVNTLLDERGSFAVTSPFPRPLGSILQSMKMLPARVALMGDVLPLKEEKVTFLREKIRGILLSEQKAISESTRTVSGVLCSSSSSTSRSESLGDLLKVGENYVVYKFDMSSCVFIDNHGHNYDVEVEDIEASKTDLLAPFSAMLIDGINGSEARRRALVLFCFIYMNASVKDAFVISIDRMGFDVIGKVPSSVLTDGVGQHQWKSFRFSFKEAANDVETFCRQLVEMEAEVVEKVSSYSGLGLATH